MDDIRLPAYIDAQTSLDCLAHVVCANPDNLFYHLQRVVAAHESGQVESLDGALFDLFIALGDNGSGLKRNLLARTGSMISVELRELLSRAGDQAFSPPASYRPPRTAVLITPSTGRIKLITRTETQSTSASPVSLQPTGKHLESEQVEPVRENFELISKSFEAVLETELNSISEIEYPLHRQPTPETQKSVSGPIQLVQFASSADTHHLTFKRSLQPVFDACEMDRIRLPAHIDAQASVDTMMRVVRANPDNLLNHLQRILAAHESEQTEPLEGALFDLFIAIHDKGSGLKTALLTYTGDAISAELQDLLSSSVGQPFRAPESYNPPRTSVLTDLPTTGIKLVTKAGTAPIFSPEDSPRQTDSDFGNEQVEPVQGDFELTLETTQQPVQQIENPVQHANNYLESGQFQFAQEVLEASLKHNPDDSECGELLLFIYRTKRDLDGFLRMENQLSIIKPNAAVFDPIWKGTEQYIRLLSGMPAIGGDARE